MGSLSVSIITPVLDQVAYIEENLRSVAAQTFPRIQHVVVDGASTDGTVEVLRRSARAGLVWTSEPDSGMYDALNKGLRRSEGDIVGYLNGDDLYFPWTVGTVVAAFESDPTLDVVYGDALRLDEIQGLVVPWLQPASAIRRIASVGSLIQPTVFWRGRVSDALGGFDMGLRLAADLDFWLRADAGGFRFRRIDEFLAIDRAHPATQTVTAPAPLADEARAVRSRYGVRPDRTWLSRLRIRVLRRVLWIRFMSALVVPRVGAWSRSIAALGPRPAWRGVLPALLPVGGSRRRAVVEWGVDPHLVAVGDAPRRGPRSGARQAGSNGA